MPRNDTGPCNPVPCAASVAQPPGQGRLQLFHALALVLVAIVSGLPQAASCRDRLSAAGACFLAGTIVFSGLLAVLAFTGIRILGAIVPIGGVLLIAGWVLLAVAGRQFGSAE